MDYKQLGRRIRQERLSQLFDGKSEAEKELAVNMIKMLFSYTDNLKKT